MNKNISKYEFYQKTGISNGILSQKNGLSEDNILKFLSYFTDINPEWLLTGKGEMLKGGYNVYDKEKYVMNLYQTTKKVEKS